MNDEDFEIFVGPEGEVLAEWELENGTHIWLIDASEENEDD